MIKQIKITELKDLLKEKKLLEFNREISQRHTNSIMESINQCGLLRVPVIGDISKFDKRKYVIIDGQHLCNALTKMPNMINKKITVATIIFFKACLHNLQFQLNF